MHLAFLFASLSLLVYVAGRPVQTEDLTHQTGRLSLEEAGTSSTPTPRYEEIELSGGEVVHLTPDLINEIWASRTYTIKDRKKSNGIHVRAYQKRKEHLGLPKTGPLPPHMKLQSVIGEDKELSRNQRYKWRIKFVGLPRKDPRRKQFLGLPWNVLKNGCEAYMRDPSRLSREWEFKKAYAKYAIENQRVLIDEESQSLLPFSVRSVGRPRKEVVTESMLRKRRSYEQRKKEAADARNSRVMFAVQGRQGDFNLPEFDWQQQQGMNQGGSSMINFPHQYQHPERWPQSEPRMTRSQSAKHYYSTSSHLTEPELVWPSSARKSRTPRVAVDDDEDWEGEDEDDDDYSDPGTPSPRSTGSQDASTYHHTSSDEPELVWPSSARRPRTTRVPVDDDEEWEGGQGDHHYAPTPSIPHSARSHDANIYHHTFANQDEPELMWPSSARRQRTRRVPVDDAIWEGGYHNDEEYNPAANWEGGHHDNYEYDPATMNHALSHPPYHTHYVGGYPQYPPSFPTRLRYYDRYPLDLNFKPGVEHDRDRP